VIPRSGIAGIAVIARNRRNQDGAAVLGEQTQRFLWLRPVNKDVNNINKHREFTRK